MSLHEPSNRLGGLDRLKDQLLEVAHLNARDGLWKLIGRKFIFHNERDAIGGIVTGLRTTDDGLPFIEVSNRTFSGLEIKGILLTGHITGTLITTAPEPQYGFLKGNILFS